MGARSGLLPRLAARPPHVATHGHANRRGLRFGAGYSAAESGACAEHGAGGPSIGEEPAPSRRPGARSSALPPASPVAAGESLPVYSGKQRVSGDFLIFSSKMSFLLRNRMMDVSVNHLLLQMLSNSFRDSCMRFCNRAERPVRAGAARGPDPPRPRHSGTSRGRAPQRGQTRHRGTEAGGPTRTHGAWSARFIPHAGRVGRSGAGGVRSAAPPHRAG